MNFQENRASDSNRDTYRVPQYETLPSFQCDIHRNEVITNFCCLKNCLTPLCPDCIDEHNKMHKGNRQFPEVDTLRRVKTMCCKQTTHGIQVIEEELGKLMKYQNMSLEDKIGEGIKDLDVARKLMHEEIDHYFAKLEKEYADIIRRNSSKLFDFKDLIDELHTLLSEMRDLDNQLNSNQLIQGIKRTCSLNMKDLVVTYETRVENALDKVINLPVDVEFSDEDAQGFRRDLEKYVQLKSKPIGIERDPRNSYNNHMSNQLKLTMDETDRYFERKFKDP